MITDTQVQNRKLLVKLMNQVIKDNERFDIHDIGACPLHYYRNHRHVDDVFSKYTVAALFSIPADVASDIFALMRGQHEGADTRQSDARYHLKRIKTAFTKYKSGYVKEDVA